MEENYKNESLVDVAYSVLKTFDRECKFNELYDTVCEKVGFTEDQKRSNIAKFYTNLSFDGRFVTTKNTYWTLREKVKFDSVHIDMNDVYVDIDNEAKSNVDKEETSTEEAIEAGLINESDVNEDENDYETPETFNSEE